MNPSHRATDRARATESRRVLVVVEDITLAELLAEALYEAGHVVTLADGPEALRATISSGLYDVALVDLDTRSRDASTLVAELRRESPSTTVVALLPCGGLEADRSAVAYDLAVEKPARLGAILAAVAGPPITRLC
jgi:DNA-binding response OmpR family regulator